MLRSQLGSHDILLRMFRASFIQSLNRDFLEYAILVHPSMPDPLQENTNKGPAHNAILPVPPLPVVKCYSCESTNDRQKDRSAPSPRGYKGSSTKTSVQCRFFPALVSKSCTSSYPSCYKNSVQRVGTVAATWYRNSLFCCAASSPK